MSGKLRKFQIIVPLEDGFFGKAVVIPSNRLKIWAEMRLDGTPLTVRVIENLENDEIWTYDGEKCSTVENIPKSNGIPLYNGSSLRLLELCFS